MSRSLALLVHGPAKVGKSRFGDTAPAPRLFFDAEGGTRFLDSKPIEWDPMRYGPPQFDGTWTSAVVYVRDFSIMQRAFDYLRSGNHPFNSVVLDSISEIQQRCIDAIVGPSEQMKLQYWGTLLREMASLVRAFRDLTFHPTHPLECVCIIAMTRNANGKWSPHVQGQLLTSLPYYLDVVAYMTQDLDESGRPRVRILTSNMPDVEAGDRTGRLGTVTDNPTIPMLLDHIYGAGPGPSGVAALLPAPTPPMAPAAAAALTPEQQALIQQILQARGATA